MLPAACRLYSGYCRQIFAAGNAERPNLRGADTTYERLRRAALALNRPNICTFFFSDICFTFCSTSGVAGLVELQNWAGCGDNLLCNQPIRTMPSL
jgi:hypothetical protein